MANKKWLIRENSVRSTGSTNEWRMIKKKEEDDKVSEEIWRKPKSTNNFKKKNDFYFDCKSIH